jgi:pimeloyl-ACP methyl ester carboxylesterase
LLFVHGWCTDSTHWRYQRAHFEPSNQVVTCDLRGHGASSDIVDGLDVQTCGFDVARLLARDDSSQAVLVGHGLGCRVVLEAARSEPDAVMGVILIDGDRHVAGDPDVVVRESRNRYAATGFAQFRDTLFEGMFSDAVPSLHKAEIMECARRVPEAVAEAYWCSILRWDAASVEGALRSLRVPLLVLQSTYLTTGYRHFAIDPRMMTPWLEVIGRLVPTVRIQIIDGVGHFPMLDAADAVNRCIATFLADATFRRFFESV